MNKSMIFQYMEMLGYSDMPKELEKYLLCPSLIRLKDVGYFLLEIELKILLLNK